MRLLSNMAIYSLLTICGAILFFSGCDQQTTLKDLSYVSFELKLVDGALHSDQFDITLMNELGLNKSTVVAFPELFPKSGISWSPDGAKFAMIVASADQNCHLRIVNADGTEEAEIQNISLIDHALHSALWSPDSKSLVFSRFNSQDPLGSYELWVVNADGSGLKKITSLGGWSRGASFSPDGTRIIFAYSPAPGYGAGGIATIDRNGNDFTYLKKSDGNAVYDSPVFSPNGKKIAYFSESDYEESTWVKLCVMDTTGNNMLVVDDVNAARHNLSNRGLLRPAWNSASDKIALVGIEGTESDGDYLGYIINGSDGTYVTINMPQMMSICWSKDGKKVAFDALQIDLLGSYMSNIYTATASGGSIARLTYELKLSLLPAWK